MLSWYYGNQVYGNVIRLRYDSVALLTRINTSVAWVSVATTSWGSTWHLTSLFINAQNAAQQDYKEKFANDWTVEENRQETYCCKSHKQKTRWVQYVSAPETVCKRLFSFGFQDNSDTNSDSEHCSLFWCEIVQFGRYVQRFRRNCCVRLQGRRHSSALKIEAVDVWNVGTYLSNYRVSNPSRQEP